MKKLNQNGSPIVIIVILIALLGIGSFIGWKVVSNDKKVENSASEAQSQTETETEAPKIELTKTYENALDKFRVKYPDNWVETTTNNNEDPEYPTITTELKSPDGAIVHLRTDFGGFGGSCDDGEENNCPTKEYLFKEAISAKTYDEELRDGTTLVPIYLVRTSLTDKDNNTIYRIGLETDKDNKIKLNEPVKGFHLPFHFFSFVDKAGDYRGNIYAYSVCDTPDNFATSSDCGTAEQILRSFVFY
jgi:hypothetical protein